MTLRRRIVAVIAVLVSLLCVVAALAIWMAQQRGQLYEELETVVEPAREASNELSVALEEAEGGFRSFALRGEPSDLRAARESLDRAERLLGELETLVANDPQLLDVVESAQARVMPWQDLLTRVELEGAGHPATGDPGWIVARSELDLAEHPATGDPGWAGLGTDRLEPAQNRVDHLKTLLFQRQRQIVVDLRTAQQRLLYTLIGAAVIAVLVAAQLTWLLHRWISRPVEGISQGIDAVVAGDLQAEIPRSGPGELSALGANVEHMRRRLVEQLDEANRAREALEQQGPAVASLQAALVPSRRQLPAWMRAAAAFAPARGVLAGDCYDVLVLDEDRIAVAVIDVSGHGPGSGVLALRAKEQLTAALHAGQSPGQALGSVAANLGDTGEQFLTCLVLEASRDGTCRYASAGHPPALLLANGELEQLAPTGSLLGPLDSSWDTRVLVLPKESTLVVYTDGLVETRNGCGESFDVSRVRDVIHANGHAHPAELVGALADNLAAFASGTFGDDITVVALTHRPNGGEPSQLETYSIADLGSVQGADLSQPLEANAKP